MDVSDVRVGQSIRVRDELGEKCQKSFRDFLSEFVDEGSETNELKYLRDAKALVKPERNTLFVSFEDLQSFDQRAATTIVEQFYRLYPFLCRALASFIEEESIREANAKETEGQPDNQFLLSALRKKDYYVGFYNIPSRIKIRELSATKIGQLVRISGQIVRTHSVHPELISGTFECVDCGTEITGVEQQFKFTQPTICRNNLCSNRRNFKLILHKSRFVDFQKLRIQETQAELPRGSMPRSLDIIIRGADQVECVQAGDRCDFIGTLVVVPDVAQMIAAQAGMVRTETGRGGGQGDGVQGLKSLGVREMTHRLAFMANCCIRDGSLVPAQLEELAGGDTDRDKSLFREEDLIKIKEMAQDKNIYDNITKSLFPSIYGNDEIKRGIILQLFGGVVKTTGEGTSLRGDINICIVGDPSTAKSQFLKAVAEFSLTRAIYTSGKASTASGLTAAVVRDDDGGFVIEAGALMLADQGICCIDEFDKMDVKDQVAIHEAMEQQTISITKAGVKATLNARTSILAAANPIGGHYNRSKSLRNNLSLSLPIMSRFDLFFVLIDECNENVDFAIATRIVDMHSDVEFDEKTETPYSLDEIKRYMRFARQFKPRISPEAEILLVETYKQLRLNGGSTGGVFAGSNRQVWRITVRQLESLIRLSEAFAKLNCSDVVTVVHVKEAARLLNKSIVKIEQPDVNLSDDTTMLDDNCDVPELAQEDEEAPDAEKAIHHSMKLSYEEYKAMANMFVIHLRREEAKIDAGESEGIKRDELVEWYLSEKDLDSEQSLVEQKTLCDKVLDRLISVDHILVALHPPQDLESVNPVLVVHPNYSSDDF